MAPAVLPSANCAPKPSACRNPTPAPAGRWAFGAEVGIYQNWTAKVEYLYVDLSSSNFTITGVPNSYQFGMVRAGVNYHF